MFAVLRFDVDGTNLSEKVAIGERVVLHLTSNSDWTDVAYAALRSDKTLHLD